MVALAVEEAIEVAEALVVVEEATEVAEASVAEEVEIEVVEVAEAAHRSALQQEDPYKSLKAKE